MRHMRLDLPRKMHNDRTTRREMVSPILLWKMLLLPLLHRLLPRICAGRNSGIRPSRIHKGPTCLEPRETRKTPCREGRQIRIFRRDPQRSKQYSKSRSKTRKVKGSKEKCPTIRILHLNHLLSPRDPQDPCLQSLRPHLHSLY